MRVAAWKGPFPGPASRPGRRPLIHATTSITPLPVGEGAGAACGRAHRRRTRYEEHHPHRRRHGPPEPVRRDRVGRRPGGRTGRHAARGGAGRAGHGRRGREHDGRRDHHTARRRRSKPGRPHVQRVPDRHVHGPDPERHADQQPRRARRHGIQRVGGRRDRHRQRLRSGHGRRHRQGVRLR